MANLPLKPYTQPPMVDDSNMRDWMTWATNALNQLIGSTTAKPQQGLQTLDNKIIDPTTNQILSAGSRPNSVTSSITFTAAANSISFFWDTSGPAGSTPLTIYRDDGTQIGPTIVGSPLVVTGLAAATLYFIYLYWDEAAARVKFAVGNKTGVGTPPVAFTVKNLFAVQQTLLRGNIPLAVALAQTGVTTGSGNGSGGNGGGGAGGAGGHYGF